MTTYKEYHAKSIKDPEAFWADKAALIDWKLPFKQVLDYSRPPFARTAPEGLSGRLVARLRALSLPPIMPPKSCRPCSFGRSFRTPDCQAGAALVTIRSPMLKSMS